MVYAIPIYLTEPDDEKFTDQPKHAVPRLKILFKEYKDLEFSKEDFLFKVQEKKVALEMAEIYFEDALLNGELIETSSEKYKVIQDMIEL